MIPRRPSAAAAAALAGTARPSALAWRIAGERWLRRAAAWRDAEVDRRGLFPWLAVAFGAGILLFFAAEGRPGLAAPLTGAVLCAALAAALRRRFWLRTGAIGLTALFCGFAAGVVRTTMVEAPVLPRLAILTVEGFVESIEARDGGARVVVRVTRLGTLAPDERPVRVRLTLHERVQGLVPGVYVAANARLLPPPQPSRPGGYDFAREAYFRGLGAVGSVTGKLEVRPPPAPPPWDLRLTALVDDARGVVTRRIAEAIGGQPGALAAALVTGKRGLIEEETNDALRAAGLYHIVSISGLHMVLAAGLIFWFVRAGLCLSTTLAARWPVKKIAAGAAMVGASAYCVFSGAEVATVRSLVMTLVMLGAILVDRPALSMRNLAWAALLVLAREPDALLGPSFQMSFGAVAALIAFARLAQPILDREDGAGPVLRLARKAGGTLLGLLGTTFVASLATGPFAAYHFQSANPYGLLGNALALPLVSLVVMPAAVVGMVAYPFGLDRWVWELMGFAVAQVIAVSHWVEGLAGSHVVVAAAPSAAILLTAGALLWLVLLQTPLRLAGLPLLAASVLVARGAERPDVYVDGQGLGAAIRAESGRLAIVGRAGDFTVEQWLRADGDGRESGNPDLSAGARCDPWGCVVTTAYGPVAFVRDPRAFAEDCGRARIIVSRLTAPEGCAPAILLDRGALEAGGATTIRFSDGRIATARRAGDARPWMPPPPRAASPRAAPAPDASTAAPTAPRRPAPQPDDAPVADDDQ